MTRAAALLASLLLIPGCDAGREATPAKPEEASPFVAPTETGLAPPSPQPTAQAPPTPQPAVSDEAESAAQVARTYFDLLEAGEYARAWPLRWESRKAAPAQADAFAAAFSRYRAYHATVGQPSQAVRAGDSLFVEVPVQIYGELATGAPFGSAGIITLRRDAASDDWRIYSR